VATCKTAWCHNGLFNDLVLLQDLLAMGELQRNVDEAFMADIVGK
jgi:hypothetical protein